MFKSVRIPIVLAIGSLLTFTACEKDLNEQAPSTGQGITSKSEGKLTIETHPLSAADKGNYIEFKSQADADKFNNEFIRLSKGGIPSNNLLLFSQMQGATALIKAQAEGKEITFKTQTPVRVSKPEMPGTSNKGTSEATCVTQTCTDWYINGTYQEATCRYELEPCSTPIGPDPGTGTGSIGGGGTTTASGGIRSGSGISIFHTAFPSYTAATNHEVQVTCFKYNVQGVTSTLTGFMGGITYTQTSYVVTSIVNNVAYIQIAYNIQMQSVVGGNLTVITRQGVVFEVSVNMATGVGTFLH